MFGKKENFSLGESFTFVSNDFGVGQTSDPDENEKSPSEAWAGQGQEVAAGFVSLPQPSGSLQRTPYHWVSEDNTLHTSDLTALFLCRLSRAKRKSHRISYEKILSSGPSSFRKPFLDLRVWFLLIYVW